MMDLRAVEKIANAVMYEGYMLYPYRRSAVKNRQRFNFGVLYPPEYCNRQQGAESWEMQTECLATGNPLTTIEVKVRFLQMVNGSGDWQEGIEREVCAGPRTLESIATPLHLQFTFEGASQAVPCPHPEGELELRASRLADDLFRITLNVRNIAPSQRDKLPGPNSENAQNADRDRMLLRSLVSVHSIFHVAGGEFISLLDPPEQFKAVAAECRNVGTWPVLAGEEGQKNLLLSAPIILYDYPQIAPESAGDLFDGTEIDEILALRILTMTDDEKLEVRNGDDRARKILERTEMLPLEHFQKLHGALRGLTPSSKERA